MKKNFKIIYTVLLVLVLTALVAVSWNDFHIELWHMVSVMLFVTFTGMIFTKIS